MEDTDWRPSPCPLCGVMREAARNPVCPNYACGVTLPPKPKGDCDVVFDFLSPHNGEYWFKCKTCGASDWCGRHDKFEQHEPLKDCKGTRMITPKENKRYVWIRADGEAKIVDTDIVELWQSPSFDREKDRIYELGAEVEIRVTVALKNKTVYRENASGYRTPFENRD